MRKVVRHAAAVGLLAVTAACILPDPDASPPSFTPSSTPTATDDPLAQCVHQLSYWVEESLRDAPDLGYDYQEMGLSNAKYLALRVVLKRVSEQEAAGPLPADWVAVEVTEACRDVLALPSSTSTGGGWQ